MSAITCRGRSAVRILQVAGGMNRGGAETWLLHLLRHIDRDRFQMDFLVHSSQPGAYDEEVRALGARILPCLSPSRPVAYARNFRRVLRQYGPYDVVHSHVHHFSGYVLRLAHGAGVPIRIAHSHNDLSREQSRAGLLRRTYFTQTEQWVRRHATAGVAASGIAAASLFGSDWESDPRWRKLYCSIDLSPFEHFENRSAVRSELGLPADARVVGHVGRFIEQKNHSFLLRVAAEVSTRDPRVRFLLIGDGALRKAVEQQAAELGVKNRILFAGLRPDIPRLMMGAMDLFFLPSLHEGLPLVLMEAQAAGLPCVISNSITREVDIVRERICRVSLSEPVARWSQAILDGLEKRGHLSQREALAAMLRSPFNIETAVKELEALYSGQCFSATSRACAIAPAAEAVAAPR